MKKKLYIAMAIFCIGLSVILKAKNGCEQQHLSIKNTTTTSITANITYIRCGNNTKQETSTTTITAGATANVPYWGEMTGIQVSNSQYSTLRTIFGKCCQNTMVNGTYIIKYASSYSVSINATNNGLISTPTCPSGYTLQPNPAN